MVHPTKTDSELMTIKQKERDISFPTLSTVNHSHNCWRQITN